MRAMAARDQALMFSTSRPGALEALDLDANHTTLARFLEAEAGDELHPAPAQEGDQA